MRKKTKIFAMIALMFFSFTSAMCQSEERETAHPSRGVELEREIAVAEIEGQTFYDVTVELRSADYREWWDGVKICVRDTKTQKVIYKKHWRKSYLYGFSDGSILVGKGNILTQVNIWKSKYTEVWGMKIREKGVY